MQETIEVLSNKVDDLENNKIDEHDAEDLFDRLIEDVRLER